jgi:hypothetical protein
MSDPEKIVGRYTAVWNEHDPARRHELVARFYAADGYYANQSADYHGIEQVERAVTRNYEAFLSRGFTFEVAEGAAEHHGSARVPWRMLAPDGATVAAAGMQFLVLDDTGLVASDYQFITQAPPP